jgi:crotonobetainyl-CoA:carnitine CoA-transferase CaiB-like acyl-CoA transferase
VGLLDGYKVLDCATLFAGPMAATLMGDHGADVIKVEHPRGDDGRRWGRSKNGVSLWWKVISRNKRTIAVDLNNPDGQRVLKELAKNADVLVENYRPGRMEKWGLGWDVLHALNPRLVMVRVTGFGQEGPYSSYPGFGTLAETMSGFAHITGEPNGPPTLPPFGLADGIAGISAAFTAVSALLRREKTGTGEMIDVALYEPLMWILGTQIVDFDQLGEIQQRSGNQSTRTSPRNTYRTKDGKWVALSASADSIAMRVFRTIGRDDWAEDPEMAHNPGRIKRRDEIDAAVNAWTSRRTQAEVLETFRDAEIAVAPIYDAQQVSGDVHFRRRGSITTVQDADLGPLTMQGVFPRVPSSPARIRFTPPNKVGAHTDEVLREAGFSESDIAGFRNGGAIA